MLVFISSVGCPFSPSPFLSFTFVVGFFRYHHHAHSFVTIVLQQEVFYQFFFNFFFFERHSSVDVFSFKFYLTNLFFFVLCSGGTSIRHLLNVLLLS